MGLTSVVRALLDRDMDVEARDDKLRTPIHYAATIQNVDWPAQGRIVMWLLTKSANPETEDTQRRCPASIGKKCPNPFIQMQFRKGAEVALNVHVISQRLAHNFPPEMIERADQTVLIASPQRAVQSQSKIRLEWCQGLPPYITRRDYFFVLPTLSVEYGTMGTAMECMASMQ